MQHFLSSTAVSTSTTRHTNCSRLPPADFPRLLIDEELNNVIYNHSSVNACFSNPDLCPRSVSFHNPLLPNGHYPTGGGGDSLLLWFLSFDLFVEFLLLVALFVVTALLPLLVVLSAGEDI